jgi:hypothetical protein
MFQDVTAISKIKILVREWKAMNIGKNEWAFIDYDWLVTVRACFQT